MSKVKCRTLHAYQAQDQSQLSFPEGAIVTILKRDGAWWAGELNGKVGYFPPSYVEIIDAGGPGGGGGGGYGRGGPARGRGRGGGMGRGRGRGGVSAKASAHKSVSSVRTKGGTKVRPPKQTPPEPGFQVSAIWAYSAVDGKELSFKPGDVIWILKRDDSGWWEAMLNGKRGLIPANYVKKIEESGGTSDPLVTVTVAAGSVKQSQSTASKAKTLSPFFDEIKVFEKLSFTQSSLATGKILLNVADANTILRNETIGNMEIDLAMVHRRPGHELYRRWVALTNPKTAGTEVQGYLKVTIQVLGPGEEAPVHADDEEEEAGTASKLNSLVLRPPTMKLTTWALQVSVFKAIHLPKMDVTSHGDFYVEASFGESQRTEVISNTANPVWNEGLTIPVQTPTWSDAILVAVRDKDTGPNGDDDLMVWSPFSLSAVQLAESPPTWHHIYSDDAVYRGSVLLGCRAKKDPDARVTKRNIPAVADPPMTPHSIRLDAYSLADCPGVGKLGAYLELSIGKTRLKGPSARSKKGVVTWNAALDELTIDMTNDNLQHPKLVVSVFAKGLTGGTRIGYVVVPVKKARGWGNVPQWWTLRPAKGGSGPDDPPPAPGSGAGAVLFSLNIGPKSSARPRVPLKPPVTRSFELRAHIYQARNLPAADSTGTSDPYVNVRCGGGSGKSSTAKATLWPRWYETLKINVELPQPLTLAPDLTLTVLDHDSLGSDDVLGRIVVPAAKLAKRWPGDPKWRRLVRDVKQTGPLEERPAILASFQLLPAEDAKRIPTPNIVPESRSVYVDAAIVGLRKLQPAGLLPLGSPYLELDLGGKITGGSKSDSKGAGEVKKTAKSDKPSPSEPNLLTTVTFETHLPVNPLFAPALNVRAYDSKVLGNSLIAAGSIPLGPFLPWTDEEIPKNALPPPIDVIPGGSGGDYGGAAKATAGAAAAAESLAAPLIPGNITEVNEFVGEVFSFTAPAKGAGDGVTKGVRTLPDPDDQDLEGGEDDDDVTKREGVQYELERSLGELPFDVYQLYKGQSAGLNGVQALIAGGSSNLSEAGLVKAKLRVVEKKKGVKRILPPLKELYAPTPCVVRLYVIRGLNFVPQDFGGAADPYLIVWNGNGKGKHYISGKDTVQKNTLTPNFYRCFELPATMPGTGSDLTIQVWDYDAVGADDLIGETVIDVENRWFSDEWQALKPKPMEYRTLWNPSSKNPQGKLEMWLEVLQEDVAKVTPATQLIPPQPSKCSLRVIVWNTKDVVFKDDDMSDIFVTGRFGDSKSQSTDIHWRSMNGEGMFNWRMVWDVVLPNPSPRLLLQIWDKDLTNANDAIAEASINLKGLFNKCYKSERPASLARQWVSMTHPNFSGVQGKVEVSIEILPEADARTKPVGLGQEKPNAHPHLSPPKRPETSYGPWRLDKTMTGQWMKYRWYAFCLLFCIFMMFIGKPILTVLGWFF